MKNQRQPNRKQPAPRMTARKRAEGERAALLAREHAARAEAEAAHQRLALLAEASVLLADALASPTTLAHITALAVPRFADFCVIDIVDDDGLVRRVATCPADVTRASLVQNLERRYPVALYLAQHPPAQVLRSGMPELAPDMPGAWLEMVARDADHLQLLRDLGPWSGMMVPLNTRGRVIGVLAVAIKNPERRYDPRDLALAEELARRVAQAIDNARLYQQAQAATQQTDEALALLDTLIAMAPIGLAVYDRDLRCVRINAALAAINGMQVQENPGHPPAEPPPGLGRSDAARLRHVLETGEPLVNLEATGTTLAGDEQRHWLTSYAPIHSAGRTVGVGVVVVDTTERKRLEAQLRQAQKLERMGRLASGVAHDFNNLLTAITSYIQLALDALPPEHNVQSDLHEAKKAVERASTLTRQLLTFARTQVIAPRVINLGDLVLDVEKLLLRLIGADIDLTLHRDHGLGHIKADPSQIEQVLVNLAVNARDAMPHGGKLTIELANVMLDAAFARMHIDITPGPYVLLAVSDTGGGMTPEVQAHLFEPFFTTKAVGKGTGLGLATCYSIVKQSGGHITCSSEVGYGTTFKIYLPCVTDNVTPCSAV